MRTDSRVDVSCSREYLCSLAWWDGRILAKAEGRWPEETWLPGVLHGVLGARLRERACVSPDRCSGACNSPHTCAYGSLYEPRPPQGAAGLRGAARIPVPMALAAERVDRGTLAISLSLLGKAGELRAQVEQALESSLFCGLGRCRRRFAVLSANWSRTSIALRPEIRREPSGPVDLEMDILSPLRLVEAKQVMQQMSLQVLTRDLMMRTACWGHYHQGMAWPPPWEDVWDEARAARIISAAVRPVTTSRYSARQGRRVDLGGITGQVRIANVGPSLLHLLVAGEVMHAGKGASMGFGHYLLTVQGRCE